MARAWVWNLAKKAEYDRQYREKNKLRLAENNRRYYIRTREHQRNRSRYYRIQVMFGITEEDYQRLLKEQNGVCKICGRPEAISRNGIPRHLSVDHDHETHVVRGLLCSRCNIALGSFLEDISLKSAIAYLEHFNQYKPKGEKQCQE